MTLSELPELALGCHNIGKTADLAGPAEMRRRPEKSGWLVLQALTYNT